MMNSQRLVLFLTVFATAATTSASDNCPRVVRKELVDNLQKQEEGSEITFNCSVSSVVPFTVYWRVITPTTVNTSWFWKCSDSRILSLNCTISSNGTNKSLHITATKDMHNSVVQCFAACTGECGNCDPSYSKASWVQLEGYSSGATPTSTSPPLESICNSSSKSIVYSVTSIYAITIGVILSIIIQM